MKRVRDQLRGLYVITDQRLTANCSYVEIIKGVLAGGARIIQLRDKTTPFEDLLKVGPKLRSIAAEFGALLIVNDNPYLAREINADGVHLGQTDMPPDIAREILGKEKLIGLSTHSKIQVLGAQLMDVDYIGLGPIFPTQTKRSQYEPLGTDIISWAARQTRLPFVTIGGIDRNNIGEVVRSGAECVAVVSAVMGAEDMTRATRELIEEMENVKKG
jgi:thiamine-phosphate pyrophosphorylase